MSDYEASILIQALTRRFLIRKHFAEVLVQASEQRRLREKVAKFQKKIATTKQKRKRLSHQGKLGGLDDDQVKRKTWEESVNNDNNDTSQPLSATGRKIEELQAEFKRLQVRTKTVEGMMKPLQKNFDTAMADNAEWRTKWNDVDAKIKAGEASIKELTQRRLDVEKRTRDYRNEQAGLAVSKIIPVATGGGRREFHKAMQQILELLEAECPNADLVKDMRKKIEPTINEALMMSGDLSRMMASGDLRKSISEFMPKTPTGGKTPEGMKSRRRTLQGSLAGMGSPTLTKSPAPGRR